MKNIVPDKKIDDLQGDSTGPRLVSFVKHKEIHHTLPRSLVSLPKNTEAENNGHYMSGMHFFSQS